MASSKRKQDEKNLKTLREIVSRPFNRQCFDCHQRGPTYANMTIGSFVCTACSGKLRGITPPHRVKSISMASFSAEEIELLNSCGNEYCRRVWLGLYDPQMGLEPDPKDNEKIKDFMTQKYEKKRFYVAPTDAVREAAKQANMTAATSIANAASRQGSVIVGSGNIITSSRPPAISSSAIIRTQASAATLQAPVISQAAPPSTAQATPPASVASPAVVSQSSTAFPSGAGDSASDAKSLFSDFGGSDPFANPSVSKPSDSNGFGFANFDAAFGNASNVTSSASLFPSQTSSQQPNPTSVASPFDPPSQNNWASFPAFDAEPKAPAPASFSNGGVPGAPPLLNGASSRSQPAPPTATAGLSLSDKYAALAELDTIFSTTTTSAPNIDWTGSSPTPGSSSFPSSTAATVSVASTIGSVNPFSSSGTAAGSLFGGTSATVPSFCSQSQGPSSTNPFFVSGGMQPPTTSTMFSNAPGVSTGALWGKPNQANFVASLPEPSQHFNQTGFPSNLQTSVSSSPFGAQQPSVFQTSSLAPGGFVQPPGANVFATGNQFATAQSSIGHQPQNWHQQQQQHQAQQNLFGASRIPGPGSVPATGQPSGANPFLGGGGFAAGGSAGSGFGFGAGQQTSRIAGNPFL